MRLAAALLGALVRVVAGLVLGAVVGLVLAPLAMQVAFDRLGDRVGIACCTGAWSDPTSAADGSIAPAVVAHVNRTVGAVQRARRAISDIDVLLDVP